MQQHKKQRSQNMKIAVVILNWNGKKLLQDFLPSIVSFSKEATVYVADNASTDDSVPFILEHFPSVKIIQNKVNGGFAKGYNDALQKINAEVYALVNSDVEVSENWLVPIIETFETSKETGVIQPKILDYNNKNTFEYAGAAGGFIDMLGYPYCRGRIFQSLEKDTQQYNDSISIDWASGACLFIRRDIYRELEGFDEDFFAHQEEIDLCWRARNKGHQIKYVGTSIVYHVGGATLNEANSYKTFLNFRNSLFSLLKNLPKHKIIPLIFLRMVLDGIAAFRFVVQLKISHAFAILKAHMSFYKNISKMYSKRNVVNYKNKYKVKSIVWSYFAQNITTYNRLK